MGYKFQNFISNVKIEKNKSQSINFFVKSLNDSETLSVKSCGVMPLSCAAFATFWPCSSVPVRNFTEYPSNFLNRARASHAIVVYAWPVWGLSLT